MKDLQVLGLEGIARFDVAAFEAAPKPPRPLLRGPVGKGIRHNLALGLALQGVVADFRCGVERLLDVPFFQNLS